MEKIAEKILKELKDTRIQRQRVKQLKTARRLRSDDLLIQIITIDAKEDLEKNTTWLIGRYASTRIIQKIYLIIAYSIKVEGFNINVQSEVKKKLERDNQRLYPNLKIAGVRQLFNIYKTKKYSSLILNLLALEIINILILNGIISEKEMKSVKRFNQMASLTRCYRYQKYKYIARTCKNEVRYVEYN